MGRPKLEKPKTNAERKQKWRLKNREKEKEADKIRKKESRSKLDPQALKEKNTLYQRQSRERREESETRQKRIARLLKDRKRKKEYNSKNKAIIEERRQKRKSRNTPTRIKMNFSTPKEKKCGRAKRYAATSMKNCVASIPSPNAKAEVISSLIQSQTPNSKEKIKEAVLQTESTSSIDASEVLGSISKKRDLKTKFARRLLLHEFTKQTPIRKAPRVFHTNFRLLKVVKNLSLDDLISHGKLTVPNRQLHSDKVNKFYNRDDISRVVPHKNATILVRNKITNQKERVCVRILEKTLNNCFTTFLQENPNIKISRRKFESLRPKNVRLRKYATRMVCCCTLHTNVDYARQAVLRLGKYNDNFDSSCFESNELLCEHFICSNNDIECLLRKCVKCNTKKIENVMNLKCSQDCAKKNSNCYSDDHTVNVKQFERINYEHAGAVKKKLSLENKILTLKELAELVDGLMEKFIIHRFNVVHTKNMLQYLYSTLKEDEIVLIQDFSENYTCLLPNEPQSVHWTQETATIYPVVAVLNREGKLSEDHFGFISNVKDHNPTFVEYCSSTLRKHYNDINPNYKFIEVTDGCAQQFKSINAISALAKRPCQITRLYFETSHGKSKSDSLGGTIKSFMSHAVESEKEVIRNAEEVFDFCQKYLSFSDKHGFITENRKFYYVTEEDMTDKITTTFKTIAGTQKIHQVTNKLSLHQGIFIRNFICTCIPCRENNFNHCVFKQDISPGNDCFTAKFTNKSEYISYKWTSFKDKSSEESQEVEETYEEDLFDYGNLNTDLIDTLKEGSIAVIKADDPIHFFYLLQITKESFTPVEFKDEYGHVFYSHCIVLGNYLEETVRENINVMEYYVDNKVAAVSVFSIVGLCPPLTDD